MTWIWWIVWAPGDATMFVPGSAERKAEPIRPQWPCTTADVTDAARIQAAAQGMDAIIHLAAVPYGNPDAGIETFRTNAPGTFVVLDAARGAGVQRVLAASGINAFGTFYWRLSGQPVIYTQLPLDENAPPVPEDPYNLSKLVNEETCAAFHRAYQGHDRSPALRGALDEEEMYTRAREGGLAPTTAWSDDLYQWVHIRDIVRGIRLALQAPHLPGHGVYTLGAADTRCPEPTMTVLETFRPDLVTKVTAPLDGRAPLLSVDRARQAFGYAPTYRLGP